MPRVDPQTIVDDWVHATQGELLEKPAYVLTAERQAAQQRELEDQHWFDWKPSEIAQLSATFGQQRLEFEEDDKYANTNIQVARYLRDKIMPFLPLPKWERWEQKLLDARLTGTLRFNRETGKLIKISDDKACLPLLDPADARDESMRLQRRYLPTLMEWRNSGKSLHTAVFTMPNYARGNLRDGMEEIEARIVRVLRKSGKFPQIRGMMTILEAPLSAGGDWNVHINVLLMCDGWLEYADVRRAWHWQVEISRVREDPRKGESYEDALRRSLRELIKYPVRALPEKSHAKAAANRSRAESDHRQPDGLDRSGDGCDNDLGSGRRSASDGTAGSDPDVSDAEAARRLEAQPAPWAHAPALIEYPPGAFVEWAFAHQKFRRTRTYGVLYAVEKPEPESMEGFETVGKWWRARGGGRTNWDLSLLDSIPGDKSKTPTIRERSIEAFNKLLGPPGQAKRALQAAAIIRQLYGQVSLAV